jgi:hypothetical protein
MTKGDHWVSSRPDGKWQDKVEGNSKASGIYCTQEDAWDVAKERARSEKVEAFLKDRKNHIRERNTYREDPFPPKG